MSFGEFLQSAVPTHRNSKKTKCKSPVEFLFGRRLRLPATADFYLCKQILFKANEKTKTVLASFIIRNQLKTALLQAENGKLTVLVSDNQIAKLDLENVKTEAPEEETKSQSEPQAQNKNVGPSHRDEESQPHQRQVNDNPNHQIRHEHHQEFENNPKDLDLYL